MRIVNFWAINRKWFAFGYAIIIILINIWPVQAANTILLRSSANKTKVVDAGELYVAVRIDKIIGDSFENIPFGKNQDLSTMINALRTNLRLPRQGVANFLKTSPGKSLLLYIQKIIPNAQSHQLTKLIVERSKSGDGVDLMEIIYRYPTNQLKVNLSEVFGVFRTENKKYWQF